jgi:hypothetical protein
MNDEDLRDLFAGFAMQHMSLPIKVMRDYTTIGNSKWTLDEMQEFPFKDYASLAYKFADAMIEAKYKKEEPEQGITSVIKRTRKKNV